MDDASKGKKRKTYDHAVEKPLPILTRHVRDEPRKALAMEANLGREATLDEPIGVDAVAVQFCVTATLAGARRER